MKLKCTAVSDLHNSFPELTGGDVLIIAGDLTTQGSVDELKVARKWVESEGVKYKHILFTPGNHDVIFEIDRDLAEKTLGLKAYVCEVAEIEGVRFFLSPYSLMWGSWSFQKSEANMSNLVYSWPKDVDVIVSHGPCRHIRDFTGREHTGSTSLLWHLDKCIDEGRLKLFINGHIHESFGGSFHRDVPVINVAQAGSYHDFLKTDPYPIDFVIEDGKVSFL